MLWISLPMKMKTMANCVCWICKRPMDCTGEVMCDLCEIDSLSTVWLSDCCDHEVATELYEIRVPDVVTKSDRSAGFCGKCLEFTLFSKEVKFPYE
jgi:hypothetical protein